MKIQRQEKGSYRTEDVVAFLEWCLPAAMSPQESIIVMLDWYVAHLSDEVAEVVRRKGHVLLFHGGGVTGLEQINVSRPSVVLCCFDSRLGEFALCPSVLVFRTPSDM